MIDIAHGRELLPADAAGAELLLAPDRPVHYDAWDVESWTVSSGVPVGPADSVTVDAAGPLVGIVAVHYAFGPSSATVRYVLRAGSGRLDIEIDLDWHHDEHLLSMRFPLDVHTDSATCGVQFGAVRRPTHASTTWDAAKFEVCAHRYVDVAESDFGVAVLDNGRYGHGVFDGAVRVEPRPRRQVPRPRRRSRSPLGDAGAVPARPRSRRRRRRGGASRAAVTGRPSSRRTRSPATVPAPVVTVTGRGVEVDAVKLADDGSGDLVVRLHEATGNRVAVSVAAGRIIAAAACDLLEVPQRHFEVSDGICALTLRPFQLATLRLTRA